MPLESGDEKSEQLEKAPLGEDELNELIRRVEEDISPAIIRTEVSAQQIERRLAFVTEKVRQLEETIEEIKNESKDTRRLFRDLQQELKRHQASSSSQ